VIILLIIIFLIFLFSTLSWKMIGNAILQSHENFKFALKDKKKLHVNAKFSWMLCQKHGTLDSNTVFILNFWPLSFTQKGEGFGLTLKVLSCWSSHHQHHGLGR